MGEAVNGIHASEKAKLVFVDDRDASAVLRVIKLNEASHAVKLLLVGRVGIKHQTSRSKP